MAVKSGSSRRWIYGSNTVVSSILFLAILVVLALIVERHPWRKDLTESGSFSLSEQTRNVLKTIDKPVQIKGFFSTAGTEQGQTKEKIRDLLDTYKYYSKDISYEFIDPDAQPEIARRYEIKTYGTLVLEGFDRKQVVQSPEEESITNALLKLVRKDQKKVYFLTGHGEHRVTVTERDGYSNVRTALEKDYYAVVDLSLLQQAEVPKDAAAVVIAGPQKPIPENELELLKAYLDRGGKLLVFVDPMFDAGLPGFLKGYGIELSGDVVIDRLSKLFGASERIPVVVTYGVHRITNGFSLPTLFPDARSVVAADEPPANVQVEVLASTSENAWAERNLDKVKQGEAQLDPNEDLAGPVPLVVIAQISPKEKSGDAGGDAAAKPAADQGKQDKEKHDAHGGVLVVAGDSDFASNAYFGLYGNGDLFQNMVNSLAEEENLITVAARQTAGKPFLLTQSQAQMMFWIVLVFVPLAVLLAGLGVYRVRRSQR